jgi:hypothetical protein
MEQLDCLLDDLGVDFFDWLYLLRKELVWFIVQVRKESETRSEAHRAKTVDLLADPESNSTDTTTPAPRRRGRKVTP